MMETIQTAREKTEEIESLTLSKKATLSIESRGRVQPIDDSTLRTCFQRDRDRIIHSKAFRRLNHKTQVFIAPEGDHYRTRLTHTIEVSQISRTIARVLSLNEDLTEAIALGHDLGHTPFGHVGEDALQEMGLDFNHNEQSLRVVDRLEYEGKGLNLTHEVRDGILNHTKEVVPETLEGQIVRIADRIAYVNHDIDDSVRAGIIEEEKIPKATIEYFGKHHGLRINAMVKDLIESSHTCDAIKMSDRGWQILLELRSYLMEKVYNRSPAINEDEKAKNIIKALYGYYFKKPDELSDEYKRFGDEKVSTKVADYVSGMTDRYAIRSFEKLFVPRSWMV